MSSGGRGLTGLLAEFCAPDRSKAGHSTRPSVLKCRYNFMQSYLRILSCCL